MDGFPILFFRNISLTRRFALLDMIVKTRSVFSDIFGKISIAASDMIKLPNQLNRIFHCTRTCIRAKIFCFVLFHRPRHHNTRKWFVHRHLNKGVTFVIHQHRIILWAVLFDQITFQYKCFQFRICHNILKTTYMCHHLFNLCPFVSACLKILTYPILQTDCFSHIDNVVFFIMHQIYPRFCRKFFQFFFYVKHLFTPSFFVFSIIA